MGLQTLSARDVRDAVPMSVAVDAVRSAFVDSTTGAFVQPARIALDDGRFLVMTVHHRPSGSLMVKSLRLEFTRRPAITGVVSYSELGGDDAVVMDAGAVTALRTGAVVGVATDLLAPRTASRMVLIGAGGQAADQVRAVAAVRDISQLTVVDHVSGRADDLVRLLTPEHLATRLGTATSAAAALADAEIVCCATPSREPLFSLGMVPERVHVNAIGAFRPDMRELPDELLADATVVIDDLAATLEESGEIQHAVDAGAISTRQLLELGTALTVPPAPGPRTVFKSVGVALQDWAVASAVARTTHRRTAVR